MTPNVASTPLQIEACQSCSAEPTTRSTARRKRTSGERVQRDPTACHLDRLQGPLLHRTRVQVGSGSFNIITSRPAPTGPADDEPFVRSADQRAVVHFAHGFGANGLSFERLMSYLAASHTADLLCTHDIAGFGQSDPPLFEHEYTLPYDGQHVSPAVLEHVWAESGVQMRGGARASCGDVVFCGHSMGAVSALYSAKEWLDRGQPARACVLIAPAVTCEPECASRFDLATCLAVRFLFVVLTYVHALRPIGVHVLRATAYLVVSMFPRFWHWGLWIAYAFTPGLPTQRTVAKYASASRRVAWDRALIRFLEANILSPSHRHPKQAMPALLAQLHAAGTQILIVHDEFDPIVPIRNSRRLLAHLPPGVATLEVVHGSGHMPHETDVAAFAALLAKHGVLVPRRSRTHGTRLLHSS